MSTLIVARPNWFARVRQWLFARPVVAHKRESKRPPLRLEHLETRECPASMQAFSNSLSSAIYSNVRKFVVDAVAVEIARPTLLKQTISQDLLRIHRHNESGNVYHVFAEFQNLSRHLIQEAVFVVQRGYPRTSSLLADQTIVQDLLNVSKLKSITYAYTSYIAATTPYRSYGATSYVFNTGLFAPQTISGQVQSIMGQKIQSALQSYSGPTFNAYSKQYFSSLTGQISANSQFSWLARNINPNHIAGPTQYVY